MKNELAVGNPDKEHPVVGIVFPVLNQFELAIKAIVSIRTQYPYHLIIIPQYDLRLPLAAAWNMGIQTAINKGCNRILVCNDDIVFSPLAIDAMADRLSKGDVGMVTGCNVIDSVPADAITSHHSDTSDESEGPDFACFMITPRTFETVGNFDERFVPAYFEDNDYHYRMKLKGVKAIATTAAPYVHYGSRSQNGDPERPVVPGDQFEKNRGFYIEKWGGAPGQETFTEAFGGQEVA